MVERSKHRRGIGGLLLRWRIAAIEKSGVTTIRANTSQRSQGFFERHGFRVLRVVPDGFAAGIDRVEMTRIAGERWNTPSA
jgi:N-acetylglutamate synthase-like GNAT family acetyltransferase